MQWSGQYNDVILAPRSSENEAAATWTFAAPENTNPVEQQGYIGCFQGRSANPQLLNNVSQMWLGVISEPASTKPTHRCVL